MGDAGEGLIDADARLQELMEEREQNRRSRPKSGPASDPEKQRQLESCRLARTELKRQLEATTHAARCEQLTQAVAELERRIQQLSA